MAQAMNVERLTPFDQIMPRTYIKAFLSFKIANPPHTISEKLQSSITSLVKQVPWLSGQVITTIPGTEEAPFSEIRWNPTHVSIQLVDAGTINATYDSFRISGISSAEVASSLSPVPDMITDDMAAKGVPVFAASHFRFANDHGLGVCICMHHNVVDAFGFAEIVSLWAQALRSRGQIISIPSRNASERITNELSMDLQTTSAKSLQELWTCHPEYSPIPPSLPSEFPQCTCKLFALPVAEIEAIKRKMADLVPDAPTTNVLVCALVWCAITKARMKRNPDLAKEASRLVTAVDGRRRINKDLSSHENPFLANLVFYAMAIAPAHSLNISSDLISAKTLADICKIISNSQSSKKIDSNYVADVYSLVEGVRDYRQVHVGWDLFNSRDLTITSWANLDFYQMDFGLDLRTPDHIRGPYAAADGVGLILPRKRASAAVDPSEEEVEIMIMLRSDDMEELEQNWYFRRKD